LRERVITGNRRSNLAWSKTDLYNRHLGWLRAADKAVLRIAQ
jgi:hypothetical protein